MQIKLIIRQGRRKKFVFSLSHGLADFHTFTQCTQCYIALTNEAGGHVPLGPVNVLTNKAGRLVPLDPLTALTNKADEHIPLDPLTALTNSYLL